MRRKEHQIHRQQPLQALFYQFQEGLQAKEKAPCIVFIDEIDAIGKKRDGQVGGNDEREQTLNQLLTEMDGFEGNNGVIILADTNRPESLDPALTRPGRFDRRVPVELPDLKGREAILKVHAKKIKPADDVDFHTIARMASGASGAELANIVNEAALRAVRQGRTIVHEADLEESVEVVIAGYQEEASLPFDAVSSQVQLPDGQFPFVYQQSMQEKRHRQGTDLLQSQGQPYQIHHSYHSV